MKEITKRTIDFPDDLYYAVLEFGIKNKISKFSPALIKIVKEYLDDRK